MFKKLLRRQALLGAGLFLPSLACAQIRETPWPAQPIRLVVPFAPGGTTDLIARLVATPLQERLGQPIIVENKPGAGATVGSLTVAQAPADGYTLVLSNIASHAISPALYGNVRYDPVKDFTHVSLLTLNPSVFVANPRSGIADMADFARIHRERGLDMASSGAGSSNHLLIVKMGQLLGREINHIPFRGAGPAMTAVIGGQVPLMSDSLPSAASHIRQGSVRAIAMSSAERHPSFPEVPTLREQGFDVVASSWFGLSGPARLPHPVVERLSHEVANILSSPETQARFAEIGGSPGRLSPEEYAAFIAAEVVTWAPLVRETGARPD
ncbi:MAG: tripartite tricarboxylate transporter substrate binding protein [Rubritepida sp.]|nr:tripartite tricarboxylate transporter substrate binding protein [Rubritepida sp.]